MCVCVCVSVCVSVCVRRLTVIMYIDCHPRLIMMGIKTMKPLNGSRCKGENPHSFAYCFIPPPPPFISIFFDSANSVCVCV